VTRVFEPDELTVVRLTEPTLAIMRSPSLARYPDTRRLCSSIPLEVFATRRTSGGDAAQADVQGNARAEHQSTQYIPAGSLGEGEWLGGFDTGTVPLVIGLTAPTGLFGFQSLEVGAGSIVGRTHVCQPWFSAPSLAVILHGLSVERRLSHPA
jgi:hypothetical protein